MDLICIGELLIDFTPVKSGVVFEQVEAFRRVPGGAPANVAVGVSKLGHTSAFIGRVGDDRFGKYLAAVLEDNRVDVSQLQFDNKARTTLAFISLPTPNEREFLFYRNPGADMNLDHQCFNKRFIKNTKIFHFGSISLIDEPSRTSTYKAVKIAKNSGAVISYDPNYRRTLWSSRSRAKKIINKAVLLADIIKVSQEELELITGVNQIDYGSKIILEMGPGICLVTVGDKGSYFATSDYSGYVPAYDVKTADATGCGDSFMSGILKSIISDGFDELKNSENRLIGAIKFASATAAITATRKGVIPALPLKKDVVDFLSNRSIY